MIIRFFYESGGRDCITLSNNKLYDQEGFDWKLVIGTQPNDILDFIAGSELFSKKKKLSGNVNIDKHSMKLCYEIDEEELTLLMLEYS